VIHWSTTKEYWRPKQTSDLKTRKEELVSKTIPTKTKENKEPKTTKNERRVDAMILTSGI
jgi:hypothetical protein